MAKLLSLIGLTIFGGLGTILVGLTVYIFLTDGVANLRGEGETGWGAAIALILYLPIGAGFLSLAYLCLERYKKHTT